MASRFFPKLDLEAWVKENGDPLEFTSDVFGANHGDPTDDFRKISEGGYGLTHYCHAWNSQYMIDEEELAYIAKALRATPNGLRIATLHATDGGTGSEDGRLWSHAYPTRRKYGLALVENRMRVTDALGGIAICLHAPNPPKDESKRDAFMERVMDSVREIDKLARRYNVKVGFENVDNGPTDNWPIIEAILQEFANPYIGIWYDTGHGNIWGHLEDYEGLAHRTVGFHIQGNLGPPPADNPTKDMDDHFVPGRMGDTVDWPRFFDIVAHKVRLPIPWTQEYGTSRGRNEGRNDVDFIRWTYTDIASVQYNEVQKRRAELSKQADTEHGS